MKLLTAFLCLAASGLCACTSPRAPLDGVWEAQFVPGSSTTLTLAQHGTEVTGHGTYTVEAMSRAGGTLTVSGSYLPPNVSLDFQYDDGARNTFAGTVQDDTMSGTESSATGRVLQVTFARQ